MTRVGILRDEESLATEAQPSAGRAIADRNSS
jgi:hypothetical protein